MCFIGRQAGVAGLATAMTYLPAYLRAALLIIRYRSRRPGSKDGAAGGGRVLLAGDAAHRFPPAGGFGMNTGIQVSAQMRRHHRD